MTNITETTKSRIHVGLDVHKDTVVAAVARCPLDSDDLVVENCRLNHTSTAFQFLSNLLRSCFGD